MGDQEEDVSLYVSEMRYKELAVHRLKMKEENKQMNKEEGRKRQSTWTIRRRMHRYTHTSNTNRPTLT